MIIKIFNLNAWLVPYPYSRERKSRFEKLILTINTLKPDIVTLQELSDKKYIRFLKNEFPKYSVTSPGGKLFNRSSLVTLSKNKPINTTFIPYKNPKDIDIKMKLVKRGVLVTEFNDYFIYNTILYPEGWNVKYSLDDLNILKKSIDSDKICFVSADLNLRLKDFEKGNKGFFSFVEDTDNTFSYLNHYVYKWWDKNVKAAKKIDYILVKNPTKKKIFYKSRLIKKPLLSDHYGIYTQVEIK